MIPDVPLMWNTKWASSSYDRSRLLKSSVKGISDLATGAPLHQSAFLFASPAEYPHTFPHQLSWQCQYRPSCSNDNASNATPSGTDACSTSNTPPSINPTDEPNPPLNDIAIRPKSFD